MGASLALARSRDTSADICSSQKRSSVRLPEAFKPSERAISRSASRVSRGGDFPRVLGICLFYSGLRRAVERQRSCPLPPPISRHNLLMFAPAIAFVDLETTGATGLRDRITEIGI